MAISSFDEGGLLSSQKQHQPQVITASRQQSAAMDAVRGFEGSRMC